MAGICDRTNFIQCPEIYPNRRNPNLSGEKLSLDTDDVSISIGNDDCNKVENFTLVIEDTGIGIRAEDIPRIFEKGYTGVNGRDDNRATGIGLYLSNKIMRKLGHRLYITSTEGKGTKVFLEFSVEDLSMY